MERIMVLSMLVALLSSSCAVVRPGEAGVKQRLGKFSSDVTTEGIVMFNPLTTRVLKSQFRQTIWSWF